jgi:2-iminobutanoate/2-iminopropanoate deaminase
MRPITSEHAPAPVRGAPYSPAVVAPPGELVFVSGQLGIDPGTGALVGDDAAAQTAQAMRNVAALLEAAGLSVADLAQVTIYATDLAGDFPVINAAYAEALGDARPARAGVGVVALPLGARVEIQAIAVRPG